MLIKLSDKMVGDKKMVSYRSLGFRLGTKLTTLTILLTGK